MSDTKHVPVLSVVGRPYDANKPLTCQHCIDIIKEKRKALCEKYGWDKWPWDE